MKFISWNVNGLRSCLGKGFTEYFAQADADIFCMQETRMEQSQAKLELPGYEQYWNSAEKKGYSGTAIFTRLSPISFTRGIGMENHDSEGRVITLEFDGYYLVNVYTPNSQRGLTRLDYRMVWEDDFRTYLLSLEALKPVIVCGDMNVAHEEIDIKNASSNHNSAGFTDQERGKMTQLLQSGFVDSFRHLHPNQMDAYTWWSFRANARERNVGWRLDYFLVSHKLSPQIAEASIHAEIVGSDHCPVSLIIAD